ncbi:MAG: hypothetical protein AB7G75_18135 [Candidatus Binatia bacterium]
MKAVNKPRRWQSFGMVGISFAVMLAVGHPYLAISEDSEAFKPGLGEIMTLTQMRHEKLWFAGLNENWDLARYELDELHEGFADALKFHPNHEKIGKPTASVLPVFINAQLAELAKAVDAADQNAFATAFDNLTAGCNGCHQATNHGFIVIRRPTASSYPNQDFTARK